MVPQDEFDRLIDRMLWAIRSSTGNPKFDERRFRDHANGADDCAPAKSRCSTGRHKPIDTMDLKL
jgi:hypothetical protein